MKLRFSIRDLLWLLVVTAVFSAWWVDRSRTEWQRDQNEERSMELDLQLKAVAKTKKNLAVLEKEYRRVLEPTPPPVVSRYP